MASEAGLGQELPAYEGPVLRQEWIRGEQDGSLHHGLTRQQAVERISMVEGESTRDERRLLVEGQLLELVTPPLPRNEQVGCNRQRQLAQPVPV